MPNTKNYSTRLRVLDQCLRSGHAYSGKELTDFINRELELRGEPVITSRTTLMDDLLNIENEYHTNIIRKKHGRQTTYQYEDPNFSVFSTELNEDDILHLSQAMNILQRFDGMPEADWISELSARLNLCMNNRRKVRSAVGFESSLYNKGMEHFTPLFDAIRKKTTVELRYQSFKMAEPQTLIVHPYYLKQYNNRWFLFCCNGDYTNLSNYPLDRILSVKLAHVPYRDTDIDFDEYFADMIGVSRRNGQEPEEVVLRFPKDQYKYVATKPWHGSQKVIEETGDYVLVQLKVIHNYELEQKILSFGQYVEVLSPKQLREQINDRLNKSLQQYNP
ncbi:helix-turn-helix transcriptional regulator [Prevotella sp. AGR2160]|uniref:helix-turn-helix transcriptional regulator n=1 Tax=Prevotella sp. AGR2160 TaxID=1280674 RepID=UPI0003FDEC0B|nr:WYL domain-containing protein [Prevotella sp. AGR2160]